MPAHADADADADAAPTRALPPALAAVLPDLRCPHCAGELSAAADAAALRCRGGHVHDLARQGYVNLRTGGSRGIAGDDAAMIAARAAFLAGGHYAPLAAALADVAADLLGPPADRPGLVVELGAGTGWYLAAILDRLPGRLGLAVDVSRYALRRAARAHPRAAAVGADVWQGLPVRDGAAALVLDVFAPRNAAEIGRVLRRDGLLVTATPTAAHLRELVTALGLLRVDERKAERLDAALAARFLPVGRSTVSAALSLSRADVRTLIGMTPSARHHAPEDLDAAVGGLPEPLSTTLSVHVAVHRPR